MFKKFINSIKTFFKEVGKDIKKINISNIFSNPKILTIFVLLIIALFILLTNMNFFTLVKSVLFLLVFYFLFFWRKTE